MSGFDETRDLMPEWSGVKGKALAFNNTMAQKEHGSDQTQNRSGAEAAAPSILAVDIGGSTIKILATGQTEPRTMRSGKALTPMRMVESVCELTSYPVEGRLLAFGGSSYNISGCL